MALLEWITLSKKGTDTCNNSKMEDRGSLTPKKN